MALFVGLGIIVILVLLLLATLLSRIQIRVRYAGSGAEDRLIIIIRALYGAYRKQITIPSIMTRGKQMLFEQTATVKSDVSDNASPRKRRAGKALFRHRSMKLSRVRKLMKNIQCTRFRLDCRIGTGDAALTGIVSGMLWGLHSSVNALARQWLQMRTKPHGAVLPIYSGVEFSLVWETDCQIRVGTLVAALLFGGIRIASLHQSWNSWRLRLMPS